MSFQNLVSKIKEISLDNASGANELARKTLDIYLEYLQTTKTTNKQTFLKELTKLGTLLATAQASMTAIGNIVDIINNRANTDIAKKSISELKHELQDHLTKLRAEINQSKELIAEQAVKIIPNNSTIITYSHSSTILDIITKAAATKKISRIIISESRPLLEGLEAAEEFLKLNIPVTVIADAAVGFYCKEADLALVGADTLLSDGSVVHKVGTYLLAMACHDQHKPFYVAGNLLKLSKTATLEKPVNIEPKPQSEITQKSELKKAEIRNIYFDITPSKYITKIITEKGIFPPTNISKAFSQINW